MLTNSKLALSVALVLATASAAVAAPKHAVRHQTPSVQQVPAGTYLSFASAPRPTSVNEPAYMKIQATIPSGQPAAVRKPARIECPRAWPLRTADAEEKRTPAGSRPGTQGAWSRPLPRRQL